jgi:hypothetical protein
MFDFETPERSRVDGVLGSRGPAPAFPTNLSAPLLFPHIPRTGGTSFLAVLANAFGESRMRRLVDDETRGPAVAAALASLDIAKLRCLAGHFPLHLFNAQLDRLRVFTILRHPVERVLSLYRFLRRGEPDALARMGLRADFDFDDFVRCESAEVFGQVRNGMCRVLSGDPALSDEGSKTFWRRRFPPASVERAVSALRRIEFGVAEDMTGTLAIAGNLLGFRFPLAEHRDNSSGPDGRERSTRDVLRLAELNAGDIALYHEALPMFRARLERVMAAARAGAENDGIADLALLETGVKVRIRDIPGRQGFHGYEPGPEFAWMVGSEPSRITFAAEPGDAKLLLRVYFLSDTYPAEEIGLAVNGAAVPHRHVRLEDGWGVIETARFTAHRVNLLALTAPYTVAARFLNPGSRDPRQLSVALSEIMLTAA